MKNRRVSKAALTLALLFSGMALRPAQSQIVNLLKINLPFDAALSGTTLPAGEYTVQLATGNSGVPVVMFRGNMGKTVEVIAKQITTLDNSASASTKVVIGKHGDEQALEELWIQGQAIGYEFAR